MLCPVVGQVTQGVAPGDPNRRSTPLEVEFDRSIGGGVELMKERMREMGKNIMLKNKKSQGQEEETARLKEAYKTAIQKQNQMRRTIYEHEDKQEVLDRDIKEIQRRLYEKGEYLRELSMFKPGNSIEEAEKMDQKLSETKQMYKENFDKFNKARQKKFALETKQDMIECTMRAVESKINALNSELHHLKLENERKAEGSRRSAENALLHSSGFQKLEQDIESMNQRMVGASQRMNSLTMQVSNKETEIRSTRFNRMDMENTIKNILRKVKENVQRASHASFSDAIDEWDDVIFGVADVEITHLLDMKMCWFIFAKIWFKTHFYDIKEAEDCIIHNLMKALGWIISTQVTFLTMWIAKETSTENDEVMEEYGDKLDFKIYE